MIYANLRSGQHYNNSIFDKNSLLNRDNVFEPYIKLKESFQNVGIILNTPDVNRGKQIKFEIHMDYQYQSNSNLNFLLLYENPEIYPLNQVRNLEKYKKIFTWNDNLVDKNKFFKLFIPNALQKKNNFKSFYERSFFCTMIASHRTLPFYVKNNLYKERFGVVNWFNENHPQSFHLYGGDWDSSAIPHYLNKKPLRFLFEKYYEYTGSHKFKSYNGRIETKINVLSNSKFSFCYENLSGLNGYITEKIFDCFYCGCVPIYWGAENIKQLIPKNCFIDRRDFDSNDSLFDYLVAINDEKFKNLQNNIKLFLNSPFINKFSSEFFSNYLVKKITSSI